jgi:hypothetical protein
MNRRSVRRAVGLGLVVAVIVVLGAVAVWIQLRAAGGPDRDRATASCAPPVLPAGQADPSGEPEPPRPAWCYRRAEPRPS